MSVSTWEADDEIFSIALTKSESHRFKTNSKTERLRCGNSWANISMAFCDTLEVSLVAVVALKVCSIVAVAVGVVGVVVVVAVATFTESFGELSICLLGKLKSSTVSCCCLSFELFKSFRFSAKSKILPGGRQSIFWPVLVATKRKAMASSTACWRLRATWNS